MLSKKTEATESQTVRSITSILYSISENVRIEVSEASPSHPVKITIRDMGGCVDWRSTTLNKEDTEKLITALETAIAQLKVWEQK